MTPLVEQIQKTIYLLFSYFLKTTSTKSQSPGPMVPDKDLMDVRTISDPRVSLFVLNLTSRSGYREEYI